MATIASTFQNNTPARTAAQTFPLIAVKVGKKGGNMVVLFTDEDTGVVLANSGKWKDDYGNRLGVGSVIDHGPSANYTAFTGSVTIQAAAGGC